MWEFSLNYQGTQFNNENEYAWRTRKRGHKEDLDDLYEWEIASCGYFNCK